MTAVTPGFLYVDIFSNDIILALQGCNQDGDD